MAMQVFKKKDADADELMGLSSAKRGGKKAKKGAEKPAEKPASPVHLSLPCPWQYVVTAWIVWGATPSIGRAWVLACFWTQDPRRTS